MRDRPQAYKTAWLFHNFQSLYMYYSKVQEKDLFGAFFPLENFSLIWRRHHYRRRAANFDLCSALAEQWGFFSVPHLLWHGASVYYSHLRWPVTLTPFVERLAVELSLPFFYDLCLSRSAFEHPTFRMRCTRSNRLRHCRDQRNWSN